MDWEKTILPICYVLDGVPLSSLDCFHSGTIRSTPGKILLILNSKMPIDTKYLNSGVDCTTDNMDKKMSFYLYGSKKIMWKTGIKLFFSSFDSD